MRRSLLACVIAWATIYSAPWIFGEHAYCAYAEDAPATPATPVNPALAAATEKAEQNYQKVVEQFMAGQMDEAMKSAAQSMRESRLLSAKSRDNLAFIRKEAPNIRPKWWEQTKSSGNISFRASMWGKTFPANYSPSEMIGMQAPVAYDPRTNRLVIVVSWRPNLVDSPRPLDGWLAKRMGMQRADMGEAVVWHELGHNYISLHLPAGDLIDLYRNYGDLYSNIQEFYADLTALRHASPHAARATMMLRLDGLTDYNDHEAHTRGASHGVGALMLSEWLSHPDQWPSVHFPPQVPKDQTEVNTLIYIYEHFEPEWSIDEYKQLHDFIDDWVKKNGDAVLRRKGLVKLPNDLEYRVMEQDDREAQAKRNGWIAERLGELIKSGRADKPLTEDQKKQEEKDRGPKVINLRTRKEMFTGILMPD